MLVLEDVIKRVLRFAQARKSGHAGLFVSIQLPRRTLLNRARRDRPSEGDGALGRGELLRDRGDTAGAAPAEAPRGALRAPGRACKGQPRCRGRDAGHQRGAAPFFRF